MFNNGNIAIIDIGSDKIFVKVGELAKDNIFHIKSSAEVFYDGFMEGDWLVGDDVSGAVSQCLSKALYNFDTKLSAIYVGVPADFARVQVCSNLMSFGCNHKISSSDLQTIQSGVTPKIDGRYEVIGTEVINFILDGKEKSLDPVGKSCFKLGINVSFNMCKKSFCEMFRTILSDYSKKVKFVDTSLAQCLVCTDKELRMKNSAVVVDIGYLTTDISYIIGGGLVELSTLPVGGGHIAYDLSYGLEIPYSSACYVKSKIDFSDNDGMIAVQTKGGVIDIEKSYASMIADARLEEIANKINDIVSKYRIEYPKYLKIYLTGRGILDMRSVRGTMSKYLSRQCEMISAIAKADNKNKIYLSTASLMQFVSEKDKQSRGNNWFSKFFN